jgi:hypothetical protein
MSNTILSFLIAQTSIRYEQQRLKFNYESKKKSTKNHSIYDDRAFRLRVEKRRKKKGYRHTTGVPEV